MSTLFGMANSEDTAQTDLCLHCLEWQTVKTLLRLIWVYTVVGMANSEDTAQSDLGLHCSWNGKQ